MTFVFDRQRFAALLKAKRGERSLREVARETGQSPSTLSRLERMNTCDMETFLALCNWMDIPPHTFFHAEGATALEQPHLHPLEHMEEILRRDDRLPGEVCEALVQMVKTVYHATARSSVEE